MVNNEILKERERCGEIVTRKVDSVIEYRNKKIKNRKRRVISVFEKLKSDILFLFDRPDYIRQT